MNVFCERLKQLRKDAGLNQSELGKKLNCQRTRIADMERDKSTPTPEDITILCKTFNVSSDYLLGLTDNPTTDKDERFITEYTGLNHDAIKMLNWSSHSDFINPINHILCHSRYILLVRYINDCRSDLLCAVNSQKVYKDTNTWESFNDIENNYRDSKYAFFEAVETFKQIIKDYTKDLEDEYNINDSNL